MSLLKADREFRLDKLCLIDYKQVETERLLTAFLARLHHNGHSSRLMRKQELSAREFVAQLSENESCHGIERFPEIVALWIENQLFDVVNRGKSNQVLAAPRPLHGFTYRFRNPKVSRDYDASAQLYELLDHARAPLGQATIDHLKSFFFKGIDPHTEQADSSILVDVETQTLLHMLVRVSDASDNGRNTQSPVCIGSADILADDMQRLLCYQEHIPRTVMVDYIKVLLGFHLGLYLLRLIKMTPELLRKPESCASCETACPVHPRAKGDIHIGCPFRHSILVDMTGKPDGPTAQLATRSFESYQLRIPAFLRSSFTFKKLDEFQHNLRKLARPIGQITTLYQLLPLLGEQWTGERAIFFGQRLSSLLERATPDGEDIDPNWKRIQSLGLDDMETYLELILDQRSDFHRRYFVQCLDSLLMKNKPGALLAQPKPNAPRRFVMDSRLLEVLLQIAVIQPTSDGFNSSPLRIDELLTWLRDRYGILIDQPSGSGDVSMDDRLALRENRNNFLQRLREIGFYRDLSDAHVTQTIQPRYEVRQQRSGSVSV